MTRDTLTDIRGVELVCRAASLVGACDALEGRERSLEDIIGQVGLIVLGEGDLWRFSEDIFNSYIAGYTAGRREYD